VDPSLVEHFIDRRDRVDIQYGIFLFEDLSTGCVFMLSFSEFPLRAGGHLLLPALGSLGDALVGCKAAERVVGGPVEGTEVLGVLDLSGPVAGVGDLALDLVFLLPIALVWTLFSVFGVLPLVLSLENGIGRVLSCEVKLLNSRLI
jgi:hypothetical protein